MFPD
jgi:hypothetical protein